MSTYILGIDEVGRGAAIGPLVMTGVICTESQEKELKNAGVRDSKKIVSSSKESLLEKRIQLSVKIEDIIGINQRYTLTALPREIDIYLKNENVTLNTLEENLAEKIIKHYLDTYRVNGNKILVDKVILDGTSIFGKLASKLKKTYSHTKFIVIDKAESQYIPVAAASMIAKTIRDIDMKTLMNAEYFYQGAGYPNEGTEKWIRDFWTEKETHRQIRKEWKWYKELLEKLRKEGYEEPLF